MLCSAQTDTFCTEFQSLLRISRIIRIGSYLQFTDFVSPCHDGAEISGKFRNNRLDLTFINLTVAAVDGDEVSFGIYLSAYGHGLGSFIYQNGGAACHTALAHTSGNNSRMGSHAAACSQNTVSSNHTCQILRRGFFTNQQCLYAGGCCSHCFFCGKIDLSAGSTRRSRKPLGDGFCILQFFCIKHRVEQLVNLCRFQSGYGSLFINQALAYHVNGDLYSCLCGTLAASGLQHVELASFHGKLHVLYIFIVFFKKICDLGEICIRFRERICHLLDVHRCSHTGNHVFALGVYQELSENLVGSVRRASGECNTGSGGISHVSEYHGLYVYSSTQIMCDTVQVAVKDGTVVIPGTEYSLHCFDELFLRILREVLTGFFLHDLLVACDDFFQIFSSQIHIELGTLGSFLSIKYLIKFCLWNFLYNITEHLDETAVAVHGKSSVLCQSSQTLHTVVVQTQIQNGVHHARHGNHSTGTYGYQQRVFRASEGLAGYFLQLSNLFINGINQVLCNGLSFFVVPVARFGGDGKAERYRQTDSGHFRQVCTLSAEKTSHVL